MCEKILVINSRTNKKIFLNEINTEYCLILTQKEYYI